MRLFLILGSIFFIFMFVNGLIQTQKEIDVFNKGELVKMRIDEIPGSCLGTKNIFTKHLANLHKTSPLMVVKNYPCDCLWQTTWV